MRIVRRHHIRNIRDGWDMWGNQATEDYEPTWDTYANHTVAKKFKRHSLNYIKERGIIS